MSTIWIAVADSARARIFTPSEDGKELKELKTMVQPRARAPERRLTTDAPGRAFNSVGPGRHAMSHEVDPKAHEVTKLVKQLAGELDKARAKNLYGRLVLVAAPAFLGELRKNLTGATARLVERALDKDLAGMEAREIHERLGDVLGRGS